jgi:hypothetical protein
MIFGMSLAGAAYWPGGVRRKGGVSLICGSCMERENAGADAANPGQGRVARRGERGAHRTGGPRRW